MLGNVFIVPTMPYSTPFTSSLSLLTPLPVTHTPLFFFAKKANTAPRKTQELERLGHNNSLVPIIQKF